MSLTEVIKEIEKTRDIEEAYMYDMWSTGHERASKEAKAVISAYDYCLSLLRKVLIPEPW